MSYAVIHVQKFKANDVKGIQIHNQRESPNSKNMDIDKEKSVLNYDLHNPEPVNYNHKVKEIIKEGYTSSRAIRKDAVMMTGTLISSDKEFFSKLDLSDQKKFFQDAYDKLKELYGEKNIVAAVVHLDEQTPHMHLCSVPIIEGKLLAKSLFDRQGLRTLQEEIPKYLKSQGFDIQRGEKSEKKHVDTVDYKKKLSKEVETLQCKSKALKSDLRAIQGQLTKIKGLKPNFDRIDRIQAKVGFLNKSKVTISKDDFEELCNTAKGYGLLEDKLSYLKQENKTMSKDIDTLYSSHQQNKSKTSNTQSKLVAVNSKLGLLVDFIKATDQVDQANKYVREQTQKQAVKARNYDDLEL